MRKGLTMLLAALLTAACSPYDIDEILLGNSEVSLSLKGKVQYTFNPDKGQASYNPERTLYRFTDDDLSGWFEFRSTVRPANTGDMIEADLKWASKTSFGNEKGLIFEVKQIDEEGMIWMWNDTKNIGLIVKDF